MTENSAWHRSLTVGLGSLSNFDLLTLALTREERDVGANEPLVRQAFRDYQITQFKDLTPAELKNVTGMESYEATRVLAAIEIGRRAGLASQGLRGQTVASPADAYEVFKDLADQQQEHFCAAFLDSKAAVLARKVVHIGTLNASVVGAREVFREAVRQNAASIIVAHNHPSGDPTPSPEDIRVTKHLAEAGRLLDIPLLDHLIVGHNGRYTSLQETGQI
ncbi:MAG: DNA repair protein RadC [Fimbriimonadaceae bacterium]|nr:DNA repair protein RadC [Fimbriimonadaceae bacterium]QYK55138.1 MAG: DNA repair protein RadC [Fimbriimonadaceae bacterium]